MTDLEKRISDLNKVISSTEKDLKRAKQLLRRLEEDFKKKRYEEIPGILGHFDGKNMVDEEGKTYEVNPNYAAKSMLVVGDSLKMIEENGKTLFKQVDKVNREKVLGVVNKKDGEWHVLTDKGSFKILQTAAEHHGVKLNDKAVVVVPGNAAGAEYAALERVDKGEVREGGSKDKAEKGVVTLIKGDKKDKKKEEPKKKGKKKKTEKKIEKKEAPKKKATTKKKKAKATKAKKAPAKKRTRPKGKDEKPKKEKKTEDRKTEILDEDDLR